MSVLTFLGDSNLMTEETQSLAMSCELSGTTEDIFNSSIACDKKEETINNLISQTKPDEYSIPLGDDGSREQLIVDAMVDNTEGTIRKHIITLRFILDVFTIIMLQLGSCQRL